MKTGVSVFAVLLVVSTSAVSQLSGTPPVGPTPSSRIAYITITDKKGNPLPAVDSGAFEVIYGSSHIPATIQSAAKVPLDFGILIDASGSMRDRWAFEKKAALQIFHIASAAGGRGFLTVFNVKAAVSRDLTESEVAGVLTAIDPKDGSAMYDAVVLSCEAAFKGESAQGRHRALFIVSDGGDNASRYTHDQAIQEALRSRVTLFSIGLLGTRADVVETSALRDLVKDTGGLAILLDRPADLSRPIADLFNSQYQLTVPTDATAKPQKLQLKSPDKNIHVAVPKLF